MGTIDTIKLSYHLIITQLVSIKIWFSITGKTDLYWSGNLAQVMWLHFLHVVFITLGWDTISPITKIFISFYMKIFLILQIFYLHPIYYNFVFMAFLCVWMCVSASTCVSCGFCLALFFCFFLFVFWFVLFYINIFLINISQHNIENLNCGF